MQTFCDGRCRSRLKREPSAPVRHERSRAHVVRERARACRTPDARLIIDGAVLSSRRTMKGHAGLVVAGFPTRDEAPTIGRVVAVADEGLGKAGLSAAAILVNADNDSCDGTAAVFRNYPAKSRQVTVATGRAGRARGRICLPSSTQLSIWVPSGLWCSMGMSVQASRGG